MDPQILYVLGFFTIFVGIVIIVVAFLLIFASGIRRKGRVRGGGVIIVGPVPIIFGTDKESAGKILLLSITLMVAVVVAEIVLYLTAR